MASWPTWRAGGAARVRSPAGRRAGVKCRPSPRTRSPLIDQVNFPSGQTSLFRSRMWGRAGLAVATFASRAVVAKALTTGKAASGQLTKSASESRGVGAGIAEIVSNDTGQADLIDIQYFAFNVVALL